MSDLKEFCNFENDIAILELDKDVSFDETPPICLPSEGHEMMKELLLVGAGRGENRSFGSLQGLKSTFVKRPRNDIIDVHTFKSGNCRVCPFGMHLQG